MVESEAFYVCGMPYAKPTATDPRHREFGLVRPTSGLPYVALDEWQAQWLFRLCQHHSHLYRLTPDGQMQRIRQGEYHEEGELGPARFTLTPTLLAEVIRSAQDPWNAAPCEPTS